jgi:surfactin synthase thioesterase subunit
VSARPGAAVRLVPSRWFPPVRQKPGARARLYLFPHGGGNAAAYRGWAEHVGDDVELVIVSLPGRAARTRETPFTAIEALVSAMRDMLVEHLDHRPYSFFGHSLGALLAYRLTVELDRGGAAGPVLLGVSAWAPGAHHPVLDRVQDMPDATLLNQMRALGSLPPGMHDDTTAADSALRTLRADGGVYNSYLDDGAPVPCPVLAFAGESDPLVQPDAMAAWGPRTGSLLGVRTYPGGHFYVQDHAAAVAGDVTRALLGRLPGPGQSSGPQANTEAATEEDSE